MVQAEKKKVMIEGGGTEDGGQDVEWGMEAEVLMSLMFLNTLAHPCARFIGWFGFFDLCLFLVSCSVAKV